MSLEDVRDAAQRARFTLEFATQLNEGQRQADAIKGVGEALTALVLLEIHKQERREEGYRDNG